jgi:hypothetical protein
MMISNVAKSGWDIYNSDLRSHIEPGNKGQYIVIHVDSKDYEIGDDYLIATKALRARRPGGPLYTIRIGYPAAGRIGTRAAKARV